MLAETNVHVPGAVWSLILAAGVLAAIGGTLPLLGGRLRGGGRGRGRGGVRIRYGPSTPALLALGLIRRLDTVLLALVVVAFLAAVALNAAA